jgi:prophage regulatory protein
MTDKPSRVLRKSEVLARAGFANDMALWRAELNDNFPRRFRLTPSGRAVGWIEAEVDAWVKARSEQRLVVGKIEGQSERLNARKRGKAAPAPASTA